MTLAAAMAVAMAVSGTLIFLAVGRQRSPDQLPPVEAPPASPPPRIADPKKSERRDRKGEKRRVRFAERIAERHIEVAEEEGLSSPAEAEQHDGSAAAPAIPRAALPANWLALYSGMLRDRRQRVACS